MRGARRFTKRIEIWQTENVPDGHGGNEVVGTLLTSSWAEIKTLNKAFAGNDFGISDPQNAVKITLRKRNDIDYNAINQYFKYAGVDYIISTKPMDEGFNHSFISFVAVIRGTEQVSTIPPIGGQVFPYTFDFILET